MWMFQVIMMLFALMMLYVLRIHRRQRHLVAAEYRGWVVVWTVFILLVWFPGVLTNLTQTIHFARVFDLLLVGAMLIIVTVTMAVRLEIAQLRHRFELFVVETAKRQVWLAPSVSKKQNQIQPRLSHIKAKNSKSKTQRKKRGE